MGVEAIGSAIGGAASAVGRGVSSVGNVSAEMSSSIGTISGIGKIAGFKPVGRGDIGTPDLGGVLRPTEQLNLTKPLESFNLVGEIQFSSSSQPELSAADAISEAQSIIAQAQTPPAFARDSSLITQNDREIESIVVPQVEPVVLPWVEPVPALDVSLALEPVIKTGLSPKTEARVANQISQAPLPQPLLQEQEVEEIVTEKVTKDEAGMVEEEEIKKARRKYVVDERALSQVVVEFKAAVRKARELAGKLGIKISGKLISKFLPGQHPGNESEAVKGKGPDGSIPARQQSIEELREFSSDVQAEDKVVKVAYEKPPIKIRPEGEPVKNEDVARVFKYHVVKPAVATYEIVTKRIEKKVPVVPAGQVAQTQTEARVETSLEDYPELAEVFKH